MLMSVYSLKSDNQAICEIDIECPCWLPVRPRIHAGWLRFLVANALRRYFQATAAVVKV